MGYHFKLIGYPIQHSLSPWIHGQFLEKSNLQGTYTRMEIKQTDSFEERIMQMKNERVDGFNITVPYKQAIIPYLDMLDETAEKMGAVNTVAYKDGKWIGHNTDGIGYVRSLESKFPKLLNNKEIKVLIIGAGGAARGIFVALDALGITAIDIANRTEESASSIARNASSSKGTNILTLEEAERTLGDYDLIIQTTSVGMKPNENNAIISIDKIKRSTIVSDIVYQPLQTEFLRKSAERGAKTHHGHTMLLYQAQYAFEIWTNKRVNIGDMEIKLKALLEGR
ncbi:shikimate dehydrogenase [Oceanobacillus damuensis]|uniref:shikimate dehydrogenase n=1 Tax=Oceanobacillus damuensis TaxID=937928 RepID=UPI00082F45BE|nr:shikimate dehydrogenase [Oceanobacillus damuensis]